jgi:hypothetical protein
MNVLIFIQSGKIPFFTSLANLFKKKNFKVTFSVNNNINYRNLLFFLKKVGDNFPIIIEQNFKKKKINILKQAKIYEKKYKFNFSYLMSFERGIGRGYLSNVDNYPEIVRANWNYEKKLEYILYEFMYLENTIKTKKTNFILSLVPNPAIYIIAKFYKIKYFSLAYSKLGERFIWSDNSYPDNLKLIKSVKTKDNYKQKSVSDIKNIIKKNSSTYGHSVHKYGFFQNFKILVFYIFLEFYRIIRNTKKKNSYYFLSNLSRIISRPYIYRKILKDGLCFDQIKKMKYIYVPLHLEPEMALQNFSPEFNNQYEMISWISKSLPSDYHVIIKEHPEMYGLRTLNYLNKLMQIPNLSIAKPNINSLDLITKSQAVATITGTAAFEAIYLEKPVLSFGLHQIINFLSSVHYCSNFKETQNGIEKILNGITVNTLRVNSKKLINSIYNNSFELNDLDKIDDAFDTVKRSLDSKFKDIEKWKKLSKIAFNNLLPMLKK